MNELILCTAPGGGNVYVNRTDLEGFKAAGYKVVGNLIDQTARIGPVPVQPEAVQTDPNPVGTTDQKPAKTDPKTAKPV